MDPEEREAMRERMLELRQMAQKKISERTAAKREAEDLVRKAKQEREIYDAEKARKVLAEIAEARLADAATVASKVEQDAPPLPSPNGESRVAPSKGTKKKLVVPDSDSSSEDGGDYKQYLKERLAARYEAKYRAKYAAPAPAAVAPAPPIVNPIAETARDVLKHKISDEVRKMAMQSLFSGGW